MKKQFALGVLSLLLSTGAVHAAEANHDRLKLYEFNFDCRFKDEDRAVTPAPADEDRREFRAAAQVYAWVDPDDWMNTMEISRNLINKLAVTRGDELVYANGCSLDPDHRFVVLRGFDNGTPEIRIERNDHESVSVPSHEYESWLRIRGERIRGECKVRNEPVHGHDAN